MNPKHNLEKLNFELPEISKSGGSYVSINVRGNFAWYSKWFK